MAKSKEEATVPVSELVGQHIANLVREGRRRRGGAGVRDPLLDPSAAELSGLTARYGTLLLPVAASIADAFEDVLTADETGSDDADVWSAAASCSMRLPGTFVRLATQIMAISARAGRSDPPKRCLWLHDASVLDSWTRVILSTAAAHVDRSALREYADTLPRMTMPEGAPARVAFLAHVRVLLSLLDPMSTTLNRAAVAWVAAALRDDDLDVRASGYELRQALSVLLHPRCAPLHVPVVAPAATAASAPYAQPQQSLTSAPVQAPAPTGPARPQSFVAPAPPPSAPPTGAEQHGAMKMHRREVPAESHSRTVTLPAAADGAGFDMPDIVDDDL